MGRLAEKVAVITGGAGGMGVSHVIRFIKEGANVVIADLASSNGRNLAEQLGDRAMFIELDVTQESGWKNLIDITEENFGSINILVNNAGIITVNSFENTSYEEYRKTISINQDGVFWV